ncbi:MAG: response regulator transcription factor [Clostridiales bacterium]|nr:response regulator transcription factor [Clostridiales bacterium]
MKLLIVDDEVQLCESLEELFQAEQWDVDCVHDGISAVDYIMTDLYDVVVLDIMLPGKDGIEVLQQVRRNGGSVPILLLTAKSSASDTVTGLEAGADDYLAKPFVPSELMARVRALYRRRSDVYKSTVVSLSNISLDRSAFELASGGRRIQLTRTEFSLLELFIHNPGHVFTKEVIIDRVWPLDSDVMYNTVEAHVSGVRKKMKKVGSRPRIVTIRGVGYKLEE